ncbi:YybH family protein [Polymorphobacter sp.]|uniref:YybH family protein n=1 Tax=Polymorphobacter sp. TaxID=1909290 RepID=UPI003F6F009E
MTVAQLQGAFQAMVDALAKGDLDGFYGAILSDAMIMDEDLPFRVNKEGFQAHIAFHGPDNWEGFAWKPSDTRFAVAGNTGVITGFAMFRGKPRDAGFRLRPMLFSQGWSQTAAGWKLVSWQQSPVIGHVTTQSPG